MNEWNGKIDVTGTIWQPSNPGRIFLEILRKFIKQSYQASSVLIVMSPGMLLNVKTRCINVVELLRYAVLWTCNKTAVCGRNRKVLLQIKCLHLTNC